MSGVVSPSAGRSPRPTLQDRPALEDQLFQGLVISNPKKPEHRFGLPASLVAHVVIGSLIILLPILWPADLPEMGDPLRVLIYSPPAAAAAPLPKGSPDVRKLEIPKKMTPQLNPEKPKFEAPIETPVEQPLRPEAGVTVQAGSATGSDMGIPEGMEGGVEGGVAGGVPDGMVGGCVGCDGNGPVVDYDQPPRLLRQTRPQYPQEAFVKKIEGQVVLEILIDANGHVRVTRVLHSVFPALDEAARQTVLQWVFAPAMRRGRAVATLAQAPVQFKIY